MKTPPSMIRYIITYSTTLATLLMSMGCTVGPDYKKPDVAIPAKFRMQTNGSDIMSVADLPWWEIFDDPALHDLINESLANNQDLKIAIVRIEQARALVGVAKSESMPQIGYNGAAGAEETASVQENSVGNVRYNTVIGALNATWEMDVWGRIRRSTEAAQANLLAQDDVRRAVILTLVSDIAINYFQLLELDRELAIAKESSTTYKRTFNLFSNRFEAGRDSQLAVHRGQAAYNASTASIAALTRQIAQQENIISILVGDYPKNIPRGRPLHKQVLPKTPPGSTTDLLRRRPDIMQAEHVMMAANAEIGVAVANFYPRVGLSALFGRQGVDMSDDFSSFTIGNALANVSGPIFTGGLLQSVYMARQAFWDETVERYKRTVLTAFKETSDAMIAQKNLVKQRDSLRKQVKALQSSEELSLLRYDDGRSNYFEVLESQQQLFPAKTALAQTQRDQLIAVVNLYKALGGGWKTSETSENAPNVTLIGGK